MNNIPNQSSQPHPWNGAGTTQMNEQQTAILHQLLQAFASSSSNQQSQPAHGQTQQQSSGTVLATHSANQASSNVKAQGVDANGIVQHQQQQLPPHEVSLGNILCQAKSHNAGQGAMNQLLMQLQNALTSNSGNVAFTGSQNTTQNNKVMPFVNMNAAAVGNTNPTMCGITTGSSSSVQGTATSTPGQGQLVQPPLPAQQQVGIQPNNANANVNAIQALLSAIVAAQRGPVQQNVVQNQQPNTGITFQTPMSQNLSSNHATNNNNVNYIGQSQNQRYQTGFQPCSNNVQTIQVGSANNNGMNYATWPNTAAAAAPTQMVQQNGMFPQNVLQSQNQQNLVNQFLSNAMGLGNGQISNGTQQRSGVTTFGTNNYQAQNNSQTPISFQPSISSNNTFQGQSNNVTYSNGFQVQSSVPTQIIGNIQTMNVSSNSQKQGNPIHLSQPGQAATLQQVPPVNAQPKNHPSAAQVVASSLQQVSQANLVNNMLKPNVVAPVLEKSSAGATKILPTDRVSSSKSVASVSGRSIASVKTARKVLTADGQEDTSNMLPPKKVQVSAPSSSVLSTTNDREDTQYVPCPAKAMPKTHNAQSAKLAIPKDVAHAEELICTDAECRNTGIKFLFCVECNKPCPKRNFWKKHGHGITPKKRMYNKKQIASSETKMEVPENEPKKRTSVTVVTYGSGSQNESTLTADHGKSLEQIASETMLALGRQQGIKKTEHPNDTLRKNVVGPGEQLKQEEWEKLLDQRPTQNSDSGTIEHWLMKVIKVTNTENAVEPSHVQNLAKTWNKTSIPGTTHQQDTIEVQGRSKKKRKREDDSNTSGTSERGSLSSSSSITIDDHHDYEVEEQVKKRAAV